MRDEGGEFGGEVSGHYYFKAFYNADSGTIPALLILELLSKRDTTLAELLRELRSKYFISGEINSTVADQRAKMDEIKARFADAEITELDGVSIDYDDWHFNVRPSNTEPLLRLNLESLVSQQDMERRRDEVLALIRVVIHCLPIPTPFRVGPVNCYLIDDDPLTLVDVGPNSGALAGRARGRAARARPPARGPRADRHHPPARRPPRAGRHPRRALGRRGLRARPPRARSSRTSTRYAERNDELAQALMLRHGIAPDVVTALGRDVARLPRLGRQRAGHARPARRRRAGLRRPHASQVLHRPGPLARRTRCSSTPAAGELIAGDHLIKHISSNPLISLPLGGRSASPAASARAR